MRNVATQLSITEETPPAMQTLLVNKTDPTDTDLISVEDAALDEGQVRLALNSFALTANNVTYMIVGERIGYWSYFDPAAYDLAAATRLENPGRMPVWGFATVSESRCEDVPVGTEVYGFFPVCDTLVVTPGKLTMHGFQDVADHRAKLHTVYNSYSYLSADPTYAVQKPIQPILRPLFLTSFLIDDFVVSESLFGAERVVITSASSKTALGTAYCLKARGGIDVTGLTSAGNKSFVENTGYYSRVLTYDEIDALDTVPSVIIDMAGNGQVLSRLYDHLGDDIKYGCAVGKSHYDGDAAPKPDAGAPMKMFFAPDQAKTRIAEWGGAGFAAKVAERWVPFLKDASDWIDGHEIRGADAMMSTYRDLLNNAVDPRAAALFSLNNP